MLWFDVELIGNTTPIPDISMTYMLWFDVELIGNTTPARQSNKIWRRERAGNEKGGRCCVRLALQDGLEPTTP